MLSEIVRFEWRVHTRQPSFIAASALFFLAGFALTASGFGPQNVAVTSSFIVTESLGFVSLLSVFAIAIFVSNLSHCLYDILGRVRSGEWNVEIPLIVSNHETLSDVAKRFEVEFRHMPITTTNKAEQERAHIALLREKQIDLVVLARYMQIVGAGLVGAFPDRIINIHHAFLPAFPGAKPYHAAYRRGVKLIGATSHYVTAELDAGPIIEQDVIRVSHATSVEEMIRLGRDLERTVLARAIYAHVQRRIVVDEGRTVIFA